MPQGEELTWKKIAMHLVIIIDEHFIRRDGLQRDDWELVKGTLEDGVKEVKEVKEECEETNPPIKAEITPIQKEVRESKRIEDMERDELKIFLKEKGVEYKDTARRATLLKLAEESVADEKDVAVGVENAPKTDPLDRVIEEEKYADPAPPSEAEELAEENQAAALSRIDPKVLLEEEQRLSEMSKKEREKVYEWEDVRRAIVELESMFIHEDSAGQTKMERATNASEAYMAIMMRYGGTKPSQIPKENYFNMINSIEVAKTRESDAQAASRIKKHARGIELAALPTLEETKVFLKSLRKLIPTDEQQFVFVQKLLGRFDADHLDKVPVDKYPALMEQAKIDIKFYSGGADGNK